MHTETLDINSLPVVFEDGFECNENEISISEEEEMYTKFGDVRKRKKYAISISSRKQKKIEQQKKNHVVQLGCDRETCRLKCILNIIENRRKDINYQYWEMNWQDRRSFVHSTCESSETNTNSKNEITKRKNVFKFFLTNSDGLRIQVCKPFFLSTLGFKKTNDRVLDVLRCTPKGKIKPYIDGRGRQLSVNKYKHLDLVENHIESFNPTISHYRREHAPNVRYLPSDVTINFMHQNFLEKYPEPDFFISYAYYRDQVKKKNISFTQLGHEECEVCESLKIHEHSKDQMVPDCTVCATYLTHIKKANAARSLYQEHAKNNYNDEKSIYFSVDLQKIIMLPRLDTFKKVLFIKRIVAYHESFVPLGKKGNLQPFACVWHEGISGRKKEDLISTFFNFFSHHRDANTITIWLDNCSSQNKNWCLLSFLVYIINSDQISANEIVLNFFEAGHTFMSADSFHHQVEQSLKHQKKTYDFEDFVKAVGAANKSRVDLKIMNYFDFYLWIDYKSQQKISKSTNRVLLKDVVSIKAVRDKFILYTKCNFEEEYSELDF